MGAIASSLVRECVRSTQEHASENLAHVLVEARLASPRAWSPEAKVDDDVVCPQEPATKGVVPPVPNFFRVLQEDVHKQSRIAKETPRFDEVMASARLKLEQMTPRCDIGGEFKTPRLSARGVGMIGATELSYDGEYLGTMKHGYGTLQMAGSKYEGQFFKDQKHGSGVFTWDDGRQYRGGFEDNQFQGFAVMTWPDGRKYKGSYVEDQKHGEGTFSWPDGRRYQGQWVSGKRQGVGMYRNAKGLTRRGTWEADRPIQFEPGALPAQALQTSRGPAAAEITPRDPAKLEEAVSKAVERRLASQRRVSASPRKTAADTEFGRRALISKI